MKRIFAATSLAAITLTVGACSNSSSSISSPATTHPATHAASSPPAVAATTPAAVVTTPAAVGTTPAAPPSATAVALPPPIPKPGVAATLWCGNVINVVTAPTLAIWEKTGEYGYNNSYTVAIPGIKRGIAAIESDATPAAAVVSDAGSTCFSVTAALELLPPMELAQYQAAMATIVQGTKTLHDGAVAGTYAATLATARVELNEGMTQLNNFLAAIGG